MGRTMVTLAMQEAEARKANLFSNAHYWLVHFALPMSPVATAHVGAPRIVP